MTLLRKTLGWLILAAFAFAPWAAIYQLSGFRGVLMALGSAVGCIVVFGIGLSLVYWLLKDKPAP